MPVAVDVETVGVGLAVVPVRVVPRVGVAAARVLFVDALALLDRHPQVGALFAAEAPDPSGATLMVAPVQATSGAGMSAEVAAGVPMAASATADPIATKTLCASFIPVIPSGWSCVLP